jgi:acyl carrier protein
MDRETMRTRLLHALSVIAPESSGSPLNDKASLQDQLDLDSVDMLNYVIQVQKDFHMEIPNNEYRKFLTIEDAITYLQKIPGMEMQA